MIRQSLIVLSALLVLSFSFVGCKNDDNDDYLGNWVQESVFGGDDRTEAVTFTINGVVYIGTGYNVEDDERLSDFYKFDKERRQWLKITDDKDHKFPGGKINGAVAFSSSTKGYVGTGYDGENKLNKFYEYTPETNTWKEIEPFPGTGRYGAVAFYAGNYGYVGTGYDGKSKQDFYRYDIDKNSWTTVPSIPGKQNRRDALCFVINNVPYVLSGRESSPLNDIFKYDAKNNKWIELGHLTDYEDAKYDDDYTIPRYKGASFVVGTKAYVTTGVKSSFNNETWEYESSTDRWTRKTDFEGPSRSGAVGFTVDGVGYIATGSNGSKSFGDVWKFNPNDEYESRD